MVGPSGSGKSTFLRCINHLEQVNAGRLYVDGDLIGYRERGDKLLEMSPRDAAKQRRDIGMVFQHFNLFPHRTALENVIEAPIHVKGVKKERGGRAGQGSARAGRPGRQGRGVSRAAVGRPAAARGDRAGAGDGPQADAVRRAHLGAGSRAGRRGARGDEKACLRRHDDGGGHPRDGVRPRGRQRAGVHGRRRRRRERSTPRGARATRNTNGRRRFCPRCCSAAPTPDPATPLWRAAQVFRLLSCIYALGFQIAINADLDRPRARLGCCSPC